MSRLVSTSMLFLVFMTSLARANKQCDIGTSSFGKLQAFSGEITPSIYGVTTAMPQTDVPNDDEDGADDEDEVKPSFMLDGPELEDPLSQFYTNLNAVMKSIGVGRAAGKNKCYKAVKAILVKAKEIKPGVLKGGSAVDALKELPKAGYKNFIPSGCSVPGAVLVYKGAADQFLDEYKQASGSAKRTVLSKARAYISSQFPGTRYKAGDLHGHIEILGTDNRVHSYYSSARRVDEAMGSDRRILEGCFLKTRASSQRSL